MKRILTGLLCAFSVTAQILNSYGGTWTALSNQAPEGIGTMVLLSDGTVLGHNGGTVWYKLKPNASGSYINGTWSKVAAMHESRLYFSSAVLRDGRLFIAGAEYGSGGASAEIYDPATDTWTQLPSAPGVTSFADSICKLLPNGNVLVGPVYVPNYNTVIYNPVANSWSAGPLCLGSQNEVSWVKLPDDSILTIDSYRPSTGDSTSCERYIPSLNQWITDAPIPVPLYTGGELGAGLLLPNGKAFFLGANGNTAIYTPSGNNNPGTWAAGPTTPGLAGAPDAPAAWMVNGKILCMLETVSGTNSIFCEYDPVANSFASITGPDGNATYPYLTYYTRMLDLPNGAVLYTRSATQLYVYNPGGSPLAAAKPTISNLTTNANGTYHLSGTLFNGISEGASYGDDAQMDSNFPLVRLTDAGGNVFYAKTFNWSSTSVMTSNKPVSTDFLLPPDVPAGAYNLVVVANGVASDSLPFNSGSLRITPGTNIAWSGAVDGPFSVSSQTFTLTNVGASSLNWSLINTSAWLTVTPLSGSLTPGGAATVVQANLNFSASNLLAGKFSTVLVFSNATDGKVQMRQIKLSVATPDQPLAFTGLNAGLILPANATGGDTATYLNASFGNSGFYAAGLNIVNYTGGSSTNEGLPASGQFTSAYDGVTHFQFAAYGTPTNVLLLSPHQPGLQASGTLTLNPPKRLKSLSILASSANGYAGSSGAGTLILHFTNGNSSVPIPFDAQDWFQPGNDAAIAHFGRIYLGNYGQFFADNPSWDAPNLYHTKIDLISLGVATQMVSSITFTMPTDSQNQSEDTGIFAISGTEVNIGPAPILLPPIRTNSTVRLSWTSVPGLKYFLQYKTNLSQPIWSDLSLATIATNTTTIVIDPATNDRMRFYRAVFLP